MLTPIATSSAPAAIGPYSQAMKNGSLLFLSGQIPLDPATGNLVAGGISEQAEQVFTNIKAVLSASQSDMNRVIKTTVFLTDLSQFGTVNEIYAKHFGDHKPARSTIEVSALPKGALVEIELIAECG